MIRPKSANELGRAQEIRRRRSAGQIQDGLSNQNAVSQQHDTCDGIQTPLRQISELQIRSKVKQPKLFSSKSLSKLVSRSLFFTKRNGNLRNTNDQSAKCPPCPLENSLNGSDNFVNRLNSDSLIVLSGGRQSTSSILGGCQQTQITDCTLEQPNISPIVGSGQLVDIGNQIHRSSDQTPSSSSSGYIAMSSTRVIYNRNRSREISPKAAKTVKGEEESLSQANDPSESNDCNSQVMPTALTTKTAKKSSKYKPFKNTTLVLKDVKNSLGLVSFTSEFELGFSSLLHADTSLH